MECNRERNVKFNQVSESEIRSVVPFLVFGLCFMLAVAGCEREIPVLSNGDASGYRIEGIITDGQGRAIVGVQVKLYYQFEYVDSKPAASKEYFVSEQNQVVTVRVFDLNDNPRRTISTSLYQPGPIIVQWDKRDDQGRLVPSGVYYVRYIVRGETKYSYPVTVTGAITAVTDGSGHYAIPSENLPVGFYPVPLYSSDSTIYYGNYQIVPYVGINFVVSSQVRSVYASLTKDRITQIDYTFY